MSKSQAGTWVWWFDVHSPKIHKPTYNAALHFLAENNIAGFGFGGDQLDNAEISHHNHGRIIYRDTGSYKRNTEHMARIVSEVEAKLGAGAQKVWIKGNHDDWERQLVETNPEMQGTVERELLLDLAYKGWQIVETGKEFLLGKLSVIHGETLAGANHARKAVETYASSVLYGHLHTPQSYARIAPFRQTQKHMGWCSPIIGETNPNYLRNRPTAWMNGFTIVEVSEDGNFNVYPIVVLKGKFRYGGAEYGG